MQFVIIIILIMMSAFFSAAETAYSSVNRIRLESMSENGSRGAERALSVEITRIITLIKTYMCKF